MFTLNWPVPDCQYLLFFFWNSRPAPRCEGFDDDDVVASNVKQSDLTEALAWPLGPRGTKLYSALGSQIKTLPIFFLTISETGGGRKTNHHPGQQSLDD
jgi:hypothetical protein